jgi:DNA-binding transcriptional LysR family regulator
VTSDLDRFELFTYVAQADSLSQAASQLGLTKASLSKQMKRLEQTLKVDLFSRAHYRLSLTPDGEALLTQCLRLKRELDDTRSICQAFHETPEGELKIVAFSYFAKTLIFPRLADFLQRYPKLNITIDSRERVPNFEKEQTDLALGFSLPVPDQADVIQCSMGTTDYVLCASPSYFKRHGQPNDLAALKQHRYISHASRTQGHLKLSIDNNLSLQPYLLLNNVESMIDCAKLGLGLIQLPIYMVSDYLEQGALISVLPQYQRTGEHIYYYYPKYRHTQPKIRKFIAFFLSDRKATFVQNPD